MGEHLSKCASALALVVSALFFAYCVFCLVTSLFQHPDLDLGGGPLRPAQVMVACQVVCYPYHATPKSKEGHCVCFVEN